MNYTADIVIIGGGIAGLSAAAELSKHASVIILEAEDQPGYHATGRSSATFIRNYGSSILKKLNDLSFSALQGSLCGENFLSFRGEMQIARKEHVPALERYLQESTGVEELSVKEALNLVPILKPEKIARVLYEKEAFDIDVHRLLQACIRQVNKSGSSLQLNQQVTTISKQPDSWLVKTAKSSYTSSMLVNAAGAWADRVALMAGAKPCGLQHLRRSAMLMPVTSQAGFDPSWPMFGCAGETWYAKPMSPGLMISPADQDPVEPFDAWADDLVLAEGLDRFSQMVNLPLSRPLHQWAGIRSFVEDGNPVCGFDPVVPGFFWLAGQGGYGVQTAPALAAITAALCQGDRDGPKPAFLKALSPARLWRSLDDKTLHTPRH